MSGKEKIGSVPKERKKEKKLQKSTKGMKDRETDGRKILYKQKPHEQRPIKQLPSLGKGRSLMQSGGPGAQDRVTALKASPKCGS